MADPTTTRYFYDEGARRKSGASNTRNTTAGIGGDAFRQGNSISTPVGEHSMLPIIGRNEYKTVVVHRIDNPGTETNRTIFSVEDFKENNYFLDTGRLIKAKFKSVVKTLTPTRDNIQGFLLPDGVMLLPALPPVLDLFFDTIKPQLDAQGVIDYSGLIQIPQEFRSYFNNYDQVILITSEKPGIDVTFPDGGIRQVQDMELKIYVYGENRDFDPTTPYTDLQKFDPIEFVRQNAPLGMFPETSKSKSYSSEGIYNGIIEPFDIRTRLYGKELYAPDDPKKPGTVAGNVTNPIEFSFPVSETTKGAFGMYEDVAVAHTAEGFFEEKYISDTVYRADAYEDRDPYDAVFVDEELENVLISMDTTLDEGVLSVEHVDMTVGFDGIAKDRFGSMAYRGWMR